MMANKMAMKRSAARHYSIAEARQNLAAIVHEVEKGGPVEVTRRGEAVAMLVSVEDYRRMAEGRRGFWEALQEFRKTTDLEALGLDDSFWRGVRDRSPGRKVVM